MVGILHEALIELFRSGRTLAVEILRFGSNIELPEDAVVENLEAAFNQIVPTEYRADLVQRIRTAAGRTLFAVVIEPQLAPDPDKRRSWPVYLSTLHARLDCPVDLLVVTTEVAVATWAATPIQVGPNFVLRPTVFGPGSMHELDEIRAPSAEWAVLVALAQHDAEAGSRPILAAIEALEKLDDERRKLYYDLLVRYLSDAERIELNIMPLDLKNYEIQDPLARKLYEWSKRNKAAREEAREEGREDGLRQALCELLDARGLIDDRARERVAAETDPKVLLEWLRRGATATTLDEVLA